MGTCARKAMGSPRLTIHGLAPQVVVILFGALVICSGPILLAGGILAYTGRWTAWAGPSSYPLLSKHSRLAFMAFWTGLPLTGADIIIALDALGLDSGPMRDLMGPAATLCMLIVMMHGYFLPRFLRPVLLPRWYREWEAAQFELEERQEAKRRAKRIRRREKRRKAKEPARV